MKSSKPNYLLIYSIFFGFIFIIQSCIKEIEFENSSNIKLRFSIDTLLFDTSFTTIGSATRILKIYNDYDKAVNITSLKLKNNASAHFSLNLDGESGQNFTDITLHPHDSIYLFCRININPDQNLVASPFIIEDVIEIKTNIEHQIPIVGWGQNANYITSKSFAGKISVYTCDLKDISWSDPKPYIIYGVLIVDSCNIILPPGCKVYVHGGLIKIDEEIIRDGRILLFNKGSLQIKGTIENPVTIQADRLEKEYQDIPGQWGGILFRNPNKTNFIENAVIKNAENGIQVDSGSILSIKNSYLINHIRSGISAYHAQIVATNCQFTNIISNNVFLTYGGNYEFNFCTFANNSSNSFAIYFDNFKCDPTFNNVCKPIKSHLNLRATNCIFSGPEKEEITFASDKQPINSEDFNIYFKNCLYKSNELDTNQFFKKYSANCISIKEKNKIFINELKSNYQLDTNSVARNKGISIKNINTDIRGIIRKNPNPDVGCFEF